MGFHTQWVDIMMKCVCFVAYSVKINGQPRGVITPTRGLRQRDPLSLYLFLFCAGGLSALIRKSVKLGTIKGIAACARGPSISRLFFAYDGLIFCKATGEECSNLIGILEKYEKALGQWLNWEKTSLFFNRNTPQNLQDEIKHRFGVKIIKQHEKYLALPSLVGKNKCNMFHQFIERLDNKLSRWKEKFLSNAGKEILIKTVAQVLPSYTMSAFKLSNALCDEMTSIVRKFWWG